MIRRAGACAVILVTLVACSSGAGSPTLPEPSPSASLETSASPILSASAAPSAPAGTAAADLDLLLELLEVIHPEPFHGVPRDEWVAALREIQDSIPNLTPEETMVEVMALVGMLSREGRDGHQIAFPPAGGPMLPLRVYEFPDGLFVTDAMDDTLVGARITAIAGRPVDEVLAAIEPLVPRDSPATVPGFRPFYLLRADVLEGLGLIADDDSVTLSVDLAGGEGETDVAVATIGMQEFGAWAGPLGIIHLPERDGLRFTAPEPLFWTEDLGGGALYVRLTEVQAVPNSEIEAMAGALDSPDVTKVILDLRHNPGGNNFTYPYLLAVLADVEQPLWVLTDRRTFSAASNLATEIEQTTDARFAGEPLGGGLNFWDDVQFVELENLPIPLSVGISTVYHQKSTPDDPRLTIEPDLPVDLMSADYFGGVDAVLDAVLAAP